MDVKTVSERLLALRGDKTRKQVCEATGIKLSALSNYENGYRIPCDKVKLTLANYYGVTVDKLFYCP